MERQCPEKQTLPTYQMTNHRSFEENGYLFVPGMVTNPEMLFSPVPEERGQINYL